MPQGVKSTLASLMYPIAWSVNHVLTRTQAFCAYARLRAALTQKVDPSNVILGMPELQGTRNVQLGKGLLLYRDLYLETQEQGAIDLGDEVVISRGVHIVSFASVEIGQGSMIGEYTSIRDANHHFDGLHSPRHLGHKARAIRIGKNVWIGRGVTVLAGVEIGDGAVIGANAVVTQSIPAGNIAVGIPARSRTNPHT
jgi:acetyltransferase-like isoleucine patch superfamily enzyme